MSGQTQEERDLAEAIALSLQENSNASVPQASAPEPSTKKRKRVVINLDSSSSEDEAEAAQPAPVVPKLTNTSTALPSRAQMERERLERVKARELAGGDAARTSTSIVQARDTSKPSDVTSSLQTQREASTSAGPAATTSGTTFREPTVRHVYNKYRSGDGVETIKFEDIIGNVRTLRKATLCTMCVDPGWLISQFGPTPVTLIAKGGPGDKPGVYPGQPWPSCTLVVPRMKPIGGKAYQTFHPKFMILQYDSWVRLVISTANLMDFDYDTLDNMVWLVDIALDSATPEQSSNSSFYQTFSEFLSGIGLPTSHWTELLSKLDYSRIDAKWRVVASLAGLRPNTPERPWGYPALGRALKELGLRPEGSERMHLECQGSSLGFYSKFYLKGFHEALPGRSPEDVVPLIKVVYPTASYVGASPGGENDVSEGLVQDDTAETKGLPAHQGGTIFCSSKVWTTSEFKNLAAQSKCRRSGLLMHTKSIIGYLDGKQKSSKNPRGFVYIGSHNFTPSAWGSVVKKDNTFKCPNTELGIVRLIEAKDQDSLQAALDEVSPVQRPVQPYGPSDKPWIQPGS